MKLLVLMSLILSFSVNANSSFGKFKFEIGHDYNYNETVVFLMNSSGEVEVIEDENYYTLKSSQFFTEVSIDFTSGSDDEHFKASATLGQMNGETVLLNFCAAMIASSNSYVDLLRDGYAKLSKWNKKTKTYELLKIVASEREIESCEKKMLFDEIESGFDINVF